MTPEYAIISTSSATILCRILGHDRSYGRDTLRVEYPRQSGEVSTGLLFLDRVEFITPITEAEARTKWDSILKGKTPGDDDPLPGEPGIPCTNGTCQQPQAAACANLFCGECCDEKCDLHCGRQIAQIPVDELPRF